MPFALKCIPSKAPLFRVRVASKQSQACVSHENKLIHIWKRFH